MPYLAALILTLAVEAPLYVVVLRRWPLRATVARLTGLAFAVNLASHPVAMLLLVPMVRGVAGRTGALALAEALVLVFEAAVLWWRLGDPAAACVASAVANTASLSIGFLLVE